MGRLGSGVRAGTIFKFSLGDDFRRNISRLGYYLVDFPTANNFETLSRFTFRISFYAQLSGIARYILTCLKEYLLWVFTCPQVFIIIILKEKEVMQTSRLTEL